MKIIKIGALWCPACLITTNNLNKLLKEYNDIVLEELDYDIDDVESYKVGKTLPVLILLKNDKEIGRIIGEKSYKELKKIIGEVYEEKN